MRTLVCVCAVMLFCGSVVLAQKKPWTEWTKKDVDKTLSDSAWAQTQAEGSAGAAQPQQTSAVSATTAARREDSNIGAASRVESGEVKPSNQVKFHVRFLSAKPVRAAFARMVLLSQAQPNE